MADQHDVATLIVLCRIPAIEGHIGSGRLDDGGWRVEFTIDVEQPLARHAGAGLGHVLNSLHAPPTPSPPGRPSGPIRA